MRVFRYRLHTIVFVQILICICLLSISTHAQQTSNNNRDNGIALLKKGDTKAAIEALRRAVKDDEKDAVAWQQLGVALTRDGKLRDARKAFETSIKLRPELAESHVGLAYVFLQTGNTNDAARETTLALTLDANSHEARYLAGAIELQRSDYAKALAQAEAALKLKSDYAPALLLKSRSLVALTVQRVRPVADKSQPDEMLSDEEREANRQEDAVRFKDAAQTLARYLQLAPNVANANLREELETLQFYADAYAKRTGGEPVVFRPSEVTTKARPIRYGYPTYTDEARQAQVTGTVLLRGVVSADGTVKNILVIKSLGYGLDESAMRVARQTRFEPATKNSHPVLQYVVLSFKFGLR